MIVNLLRSNENANFAPSLNGKGALPATAEDHLNEFGYRGPAASFARRTRPVFAGRGMGRYEGGTHVSP